MKLLAPLDYDNPNIGNTSIPFIRYKSPNKTAEDLLFNPGGPAQSGIQSTLNELSLWVSYVGMSHNFISFDPRGVNNSDISLSCFQKQPANGALFDNGFNRPMFLDSEQSIRDKYEHDTAYGKWCKEALQNSTAKYANTVAVAHDMLHYVKTAAKQAGGNPDTARLRYFGTSYGTILGQTFAALFPDRVGRMILDGVDDAAEYYAGTWYKTASQDDQAIRFFFEACYNAGPKLCGFYEDSPQKIELRYASLLHNIDARPIPLANPEIMQIPVTLTKGDLQSAFISLLKAPMLAATVMADLLVQLEQRNGTLLAINAGLTSITGSHIPGTYVDYSMAEATVAIRCIDNAGRFPVTNLTQFEDYVQYSLGQSAYFGGLTATSPVKCLNLNIVPPPNQQFLLNGGVPSANKTAHPILFTSQKIDPVTPLKGAQVSANRFPGSVLLVQDSEGHGACSWKSDCSSKFVQAYLIEGTLPPANTTCEADGRPFFDIPSN